MSLVQAFNKPNKFDNNLIVIGAGSGGLVTAYIAATVKAKVTLVEKHRMGGDCLNTGCVPSKALIRSAKWLSLLKRSHEFGFTATPAEFNFADVMARVKSIVARIAPHDSVERYTRLGVNVVIGEAKIVSPWAVEVKTDTGIQTLTTRAIVIAAGARPFIPPIPGIQGVAVLTSDTIWGLTELPKRLLVLGGGPIGCEMAQAFARLGSQVTLVEMADRLLPREDQDVSERVMARLRSEGVDLRMAHVAKSFLVRKGRKSSVG